MFDIWAYGIPIFVVVGILIATGLQRDLGTRWAFFVILFCWAWPLVVALAILMALFVAAMIAAGYFQWWWFDRPKKKL